MNKLASVLAVAGAFAFAIPATSASAASEDYIARVTATGAATNAHDDMIQAFDTDTVKPGHFLWHDVPASVGPERVVISLGDQLAYLYRGNTMMAVASISTGRPGHDTPSGVFEILNKETMHHSKKYDNAPMPFTQMITSYGVALHAGHNPGEAASHGCIRMPLAFAKKLFTVTDVGTPVLIGA